MSASAPEIRAPWKKGKLVGQKAPLHLKDIWTSSILTRLISK